MWDENDKNGFIRNANNGVGQVNINTLFGNEIKNLCLNKKNKSFLEIGTWNGLGSTKCFVDSLITRDDNYVFYSLECNKEKSEFAKNLYTSHKNIHMVNEVIWNNEPEQFSNIFNENKITPFDGGKLYLG